ncbi:MAG: 3-dehydroquinate synthase [Coriobacteriales bacterium]|nr:3-dehydroquinate synthase [Coriobacteriales bacterium]
MSDVITVHVPTPSRTYDVIVGSGILDSLGDRVASTCHPDAVLVVTDSNVGPLYLQRVVTSLEKAGLRTATLTIPAGEQYKRLVTFGAILEAAAQASLTRDGVIVALGGGVVGDMAGFAAASYMRGIEVVQVPTTLLAMVDSSVGGKTAIDLESGKNLVGAFLQPSLVLADVACLATLQPDVFVDGIGEIVKHGILADAKLFDELAEHPLTQYSDASYLARIVARNVEIKRDVVSTDEKERGLRQTLNLGHTIGHAVEAASGFTLGHGHCVAIGLCCVARAAEALGWAEDGLSSRIESCITAQGLPIDTTIASDDIIKYATHDKKRHGDVVNLVIPSTIGGVGIRLVSLDDFRHIVCLGCGVTR